MSIGCLLLYRLFTFVWVIYFQDSQTLSSSLIPLMDKVKNNDTVAQAEESLFSNDDESEEPVKEKTKEKKESSKRTRDKATRSADVEEEERQLSLNKAFWKKQRDLLKFSE